MKQKLFFLADNRNQRRRRWSKERKRERELLAGCCCFLFCGELTKNKKKEEELLSEKARARELNKQSLIFQGILYIVTGPAVMRYPVIIRRGFRGCHGGIISPRVGSYRCDASLLWYSMATWWWFLKSLLAHLGGIVWLSFCIEATTNKQRLSRVIFTFLCDCLYIYLLDAATRPTTFVSFIIFYRPPPQRQHIQFCFHKQQQRESIRQTSSTLNGWS